MLDNTTPFTMPVMPTANNSGGLFGGDGWWAIIIFALIFGWGNGGWGGNASAGAMDNYVLASDFATLQRQIDSTTSEIKQQGNAISNGICSLGYDQLAQMDRINQNVADVGYNLQNAITTNGYETRNAIQQNAIADMQSVNAIQRQISDCCCANEKMIMQSNFDAAQANCATLQAIDKVGDRIIDYMSSHEAQSLRDENFALKLSASQAAQNNYLQNLIKPPINPCYVTQNPYCSCGNAYGFYGTTIA